MQDCSGFLREFGLQRNNNYFLLLLPSTFNQPNLKKKKRRKKQKNQRKLFKIEIFVNGNNIELLQTGEKLNRSGNVERIVFSAVAGTSGNTLNIAEYMNCYALPIPIYNQTSTNGVNSSGAIDQPRSEMEKHESTNNTNTWERNEVVISSIIVKYIM